MLRSWLPRSNRVARYELCSRCLRLSRGQPEITTLHAAQTSSKQFLRSLQTTASTTAGDHVPLRKQLKAEAKALKARKREKKDHEEASRQGWELTVGIEIHAQLNTEAKLFSSKQAKYDFSLQQESV